MIHINDMLIIRAKRSFFNQTYLRHSCYVWAAQKENKNCQFDFLTPKPKTGQFDFLSHTHTQSQQVPST